MHTGDTASNKNSVNGRHDLPFRIIFFEVYVMSCHCELLRIIILQKTQAKETQK